jgi:hypothetical protein
MGNSQLLQWRSGAPPIDFTKDKDTGTYVSRQIHTTEQGVVVTAKSTLRSLVNTTTICSLISGIMGDQRTKEKDHRVSPCNIVRVKTVPRLKISSLVLPRCILVLHTPSCWLMLTLRDGLPMANAMARASSR